MQQPKELPHELSTGEGRIQVQVRGMWAGPDLVVIITGGTHPHVGAVAVAQPRPSLRGDGSVSATASVITLLGHKESELAFWAAEFLAARLNTPVVVTAGLHVDNATETEIRELDFRARRLISQWATQWNGRQPVEAPHVPAAQPGPPPANGMPAAPGAAAPNGKPAAPEAGPGNGMPATPQATPANGNPEAAGQQDEGPATGPDQGTPPVEGRPWT